MNACASTGSRIGEAQVGVKGWKWCWHCYPKLNSSAFKRYTWLLFLPLTLTLRPTGLILPAKMVHATLLLPSPMACSLGWASQHITFPFDPAAHERAVVWPHKYHTYQQPEGKKTCDCTAENCIENCICCTCSDGQMKALQISFSSCTTKLLGVCFHTFLFCFRFSFVI